MEGFTARLKVDMKLRFDHCNWFFVCFAVLWFPAISLGQSERLPGWTVAKVKESTPDLQTCVATWKGSDAPELSINALGPLLQLVISSPEFPRERAEETVLLEKKNLGQLKRTATVGQSTYGITIDSDVDAYLLAEGTLVVTIQSKRYSLDVSDVSSVIDDLRRCVGQPTRAELQVSKKPAFGLPDGWEPIKIGESCAARLEGDEVNTTITINNDNKILLVAGRRDWNYWGGEIDLTVQFDSAPPRAFRASRWNNLVLVLLIDDKDVSALRNASRIKWHLPNGEFATRVHDVGSAIDLVRACRDQNKNKVGH